MNPNYNINNPALVYSYLNSNIKTTAEKRFERGEVFTPLSIVNDMLDKLPEEVWINPNLRWLDPSVGIGNFMALVYERLMIGLMNVITNRKKRQKHILENMLYMVEISPESIAILKTIFCDSQYKLNIFEGSYIDNDENKNVR
jgi:type I restriction-modification system DNA methylase subunit